MGLLRFDEDYNPVDKAFSPARGIVEALSKRFF